MQLNLNKNEEADISAFFFYLGSSCTSNDKYKYPLSQPLQIKRRMPQNRITAETPKEATENSKQLNLVYKNLNESGQVLK